MNTLCGIELIPGSIYDIQILDTATVLKYNYYMVFRELTTTPEMCDVVGDYYTPKMDLLGKNYQLPSYYFLNIKLLYNLSDII